MTKADRWIQRLIITRNFTQGKTTSWTAHETPKNACQEQYTIPKSWEEILTAKPKKKPWLDGILPEAFNCSKSILLNSMLKLLCPSWKDWMAPQKTSILSPTLRTKRTEVIVTSTRGSCNWASYLSGPEQPAENRRNMCVFRLKCSPIDIIHFPWQHALRPTWFSFQQEKRKEQR